MKVIKKMFAIYDVKQGVYSAPFLQLTEGEAIRSATQAVSDENSTLNKFPEDFRLEFIGDINLCTGEIVQVNAPKSIIDLAQLKK